MATFGGSVARRYARALFEIGLGKNLHEVYGEELEALASTYAASAELRQALENPVFKLDQRRGILEKLLPRLTPSTDVRSFVLLLVDRRRTSALPAIARAYRELVDEKLGRVRATVISAKPLDPATAASVQRALEKRVGRRVLMSTAVDPALIGGIVARVGDQVFDGSIQNRLETLRTRILN